MKLGELSLTISLPLVALAVAWKNRRKLKYKKINCDEVLHLTNRFNRNKTLDDFDYACKKCWTRLGVRNLLNYKQQTKGKITKGMLFCDNCNSYFSYPEMNTLYMRGDILNEKGMIYNNACAEHLPERIKNQFITQDDVFSVITGTNE